MTSRVLRRTIARLNGNASLGHLQNTAMYPFRTGDVVLLVPRMGHSDSALLFASKVAPCFTLEGDERVSQQSSDEGVGLDLRLGWTHRVLRH